VRGSLVATLAIGGLVLGCSRDDRQDARTGTAAGAGAPAVSDVLEGALLVDGKPVGSMQCRPGANVHIFVEVATPAGVLRFEDQRLSWNGEPLSCTRLDRSWGGGRRPDGTAYWRGTLGFDCRAGARTYAGDLRLDCGAITAEERAQLDAQRARLRAQQADDAEPAGSGAN